MWSMCPTTLSRRFCQKPSSRADGRSGHTACNSPLVPVGGLGEIVAGGAEGHGTVFLLQVVAIRLVFVVHPDLCQRRLRRIPHDHLKAPVVATEHRLPEIINVHLYKRPRAAHG